MENDWKSCEQDFLVNREVLAINTHNEYMIGYVSEGQSLNGMMTKGGKTNFICESDDGVLPNVTHWMYLPSPPTK